MPLGAVNRIRAKANSPQPPNPLQKPASKACGYLF
jgi:hypothetical protein